MDCTARGFRSDGIFVKLFGQRFHKNYTKEKLIYQKISKKYPDCPNFLKFFAFEDGQQQLRFEFCPGITVEQLIVQDVLPQAPSNLAQHLFKNILCAVDKVHAMKYAHGDIK